MNAVRRAIVFGASVAAFTLMMSAGSAQASFTIKFDCHGTNGIPSWATTTNKITLQYRYDKVWTDAEEWYGVPCNSESESDGLYTTYVSRDVSHVTAVRLTTNGGNTFWVDQMSILNSDDITIRSWGVQNSTGFCLSTNPADGNMPECHNGVALTTYEFWR